MVQYTHTDFEGPVNAEAHRIFEGAGELIDIDNRYLRDIMTEEGYRILNLEKE